MPVSCESQAQPTTRRCSLGRILDEPEDEAMVIFDKYRTGVARRLKKPEALKMLEVEFNLSEIDALMMFQSFDKDDNEVMSWWEFRLFYQTIGMGAESMITLFKQLQIDETGFIDIEKAFDALKEVDSPKGKLTDEEIEMFLKTTAGEAREIDLHKFLNMMCRIKIHRGNKSE